MTVEKTKRKQLLRPITTGANITMNQSNFLSITCNSLKAREKSRVHGAIGFVSHWLKTGASLFSQSDWLKRSNCNHVVTFDSHLKTALITIVIIIRRRDWLWVVTSSTRANRAYSYSHGCTGGSCGGNNLHLKRFPRIGLSFMLVSSTTVRIRIWPIVKGILMMHLVK